MCYLHNIHVKGHIYDFNQYSFQKIHRFTRNTEDRQLDWLPFLVSNIIYSVVNDRRDSPS